MKIWGVRAGLIGDLVMALPILTYLDRKYPGSYKYWAVHKKCSQAVPFFVNHPLIDRIKVTDEWTGIGPSDKIILDKCDLVFDIAPPVRDQNWRNEMRCIDQTARMAGIDDLNDVITPAEKIPILQRWFPSYSFSNQPTSHGYVDIITDNNFEKANHISIWPFANYMMKLQRSPSVGWWEALISIMIEAGYVVHHYGWYEEPNLSESSNYQKHTSLSLFDQVRSALECKASIGTDSGSMWVLGALGHPGIELMTFHEFGHKQNPEALMPPYANHRMMFNPSNINLIKPKHVLDTLENIS
jgi:hypothetical protein